MDNYFRIQLSDLISVITEEYGYPFFIIKDLKKAIKMWEK